MRRRLPALTLLALLAGCGATRAPVPAPAAPAAPAGSVRLSYAAAGVTLHAPANWPAGAATSPGVAVISSGGAVVSVYRYARAEALPDTPRALRAALPRLVAGARKRDPGITFIRTATIRVGGLPALVLVGRETVGGVLHGVRSVHVFGQGGEVVVDAIAPVAAFPALDASVFRRLAASVRLSPPSA